MPRLIAALVRHGDYHQLADTPSAHQPFPLTDKGRGQAALAAKKILSEAESEGWKIEESLHSSRLLRAWETAHIIAQNLNGEYSVTSFDELAERSMGSAANLTIEQIETIVRDDPRYEPLPADWKSNSRFRLPLQGAESLLQSGARVAGHLKQSMKELYRRATVDTVQIYVGHGAAIRHAAYALGVLEFEQVARLSMYHAEPVYIEFSRAGWQHVAGRWKIREQANELD